MRISVQRKFLILASCCRRLHNVANTRDHSFLLRTPKFALSLALTVALVAYGLDCVGIATPELAMQCCSTMHCHRHGHRGSHLSQDCCNTTSQIQAALGQPSSKQGVSFCPVALGVAQRSSDAQIMERCASTMVVHSHDPPSSYPTLVTSLRI